MQGERAPNTMKKKGWSREEALVPILFGSYCIAYLVQVYGLPVQSTKYPHMLMFFIVILLVSIIFTYILIPATKEGPAASKETEKARALAQRPQLGWTTLYKPASVIIATFVYPQIMTVLGFTITTTIFLMVLLRIFGTRQISTILAISLGFAFLLFFSMTFYLKITLPPFALADLPLDL